LSLQDFLEKTKLSFSVSAYDWWDLLGVPFTCQNIEADLHYFIPNEERYAEIFL
jgi:hypothetical protein